MKHRGLKLNKIKKKRQQEEDEVESYITVFSARILGVKYKNNENKNGTVK